MRNGVHALLLYVILACAASWASAQACVDLDGDQSLAGHECADATDCEDRSWWRRPDALENCDGLDTNCDGTLDEGCDRWCEEPALFPELRELASGVQPTTWQACASRSDQGVLVGFASYLEGASDLNDLLLYAREFDPRGLPVYEATQIGDDSPEYPRDTNCNLAMGGDRALLAWHDASRGPSDPEQYHLMVRVVDNLGRPVAPAIDLTAEYGKSAWAGAYPRVVWDGERFAVFWRAIGTFADNHKLLMSVIFPDGTPGTPLTRLVTDDIDGKRSQIDKPRAVWTGDKFIVVVTKVEDGDDVLFSLPVSREGTPLAAATEVAREQGVISVGWGRSLHHGGDRLLLQYHYVPGTEADKPRLIFLDLDGLPLNPPGRIDLAPPSARPTAGTAAAWTGEMFVVAEAKRISDASGTSYRWWSWRVLPDGQVLDPEPVLLADHPQLGDLLDMFWGGDRFWVISKKKGDKIARAELVCSCQDLDGDGYSACTGEDCDDTSFDAHRGGTEQCRGMVDEDCDGLFDCDDPDCPAGTGPGDVASLVWSGGVWQWETVAGAEVYDLARGLMSDRTRRGDLVQAECSGEDLPFAQWDDDGRLPPAGDVLWFLVRAEGLPCHASSWGPASSPRMVGGCH